MATQDESAQSGVPFKVSKSLHDWPELADRYTKKYVNTESNVLLHDPKNFSLKPAYWQRWKDDRYMRLIDYVRTNIDLMAFAEQEGVAGEEVQHLFTHVICEQLYRHVELVRKRTEANMIEHMKLLSEHGTPSRKWTKEGRKGELSRVFCGEVQLIEPNGDKVAIELPDLVKEDLEYLKEELTQQQWTVLHTAREDKKRKAVVLDCD